MTSPQRAGAASSRRARVGCGTTTTSTAPTSDRYPSLRALKRGLALAAVIGLAHQPVRAAPEPYDLTAILSLSGVVAFTGRAMQQSLHIIEGTVNAGGGIAG